MAPNPKMALGFSESARPHTKFHGPAHALQQSLAGCVHTKLASSPLRPASLPSRRYSRCQCREGQKGSWNRKRVPEPRGSWRPGATQLWRSFSIPTATALALTAKAGKWSGSQIGLKGLDASFVWSSTCEGVGGVMQRSPRSWEPHDMQHGGHNIQWSWSPFEWPLKGLQKAVRRPTL